MDDDDERMKRKGCLAMVCTLCLARVAIAKCIVGTAVYQVGLASSIHLKKRRALKPGVQKTLEPAERGANSPAIKP